jgi:uncharacterized protein YuzE
MWPYIEDDFMEIGDSGWVSIGEGLFRNIKTGHTIEEETGIEYDKDGNVVVYPEDER